MTDMTKQFEQMTEMFKAVMPTVKPNKNGYELRTKVLEFAQNQTWRDYYAKWGQFETSVKKEGDEVVTTINLPEVPRADTVLETANKFYEFVSNGSGLNKK